MPTLISGSRRLFNALGLAPVQHGAVSYKGLLVAGKNLTVYLGPGPPLGVNSL